jgi:hypothetical protein
MTVTELTQFRLLAPTAFLTSKELGYRMKVLHATTGHTCHLLLSGTSDVFLLESWDEVSSYEHFQQTAEHEAIMKIIGLSYPAPLKNIGLTWLCRGSACGIIYKPHGYGHKGYLSDAAELAW